MDETTAIQKAEQPENVFLAARNSAEMENCQRQLADWLKMKVAACKSEYKELSVAVEHAEKNKWAVSALRSSRSRAKARVTYYEKLLAATEAGYVMLPWMWNDVFAIRVVRKEASRISSGTQQYHQPAIPDQSCDIAPVGEGKYVSSSSEGYEDSTKVNESGKEITKYFSVATDFRDVEFPVTAAKPVLMNATAQAMALKIFDEIGIAPARRGKDPIIVGAVKGPRTILFLIAWYLDTRAL